MSSSYNIEKLKEIHKHIARMVVLGHSDQDIADALGVTTVMVAYTRKSDLVQEQIAILNGQMDAETVDLAKEIRKLAPKALKTMEKIMEDPTATDRDRVSIAKDILDREGTTAVKRTVNVNHNHLTKERIEAIKKAALEFSGAVSEATIIEETNGKLSLREGDSRVREEDVHVADG